MVLVNPDAELDPDSLLMLVAAAGHGVHGPVGGRAHHEDGSFDPRCTLGRPRLRGALGFAIGLDTVFRGSSWFDPEFGPSHLDWSAGVVEVEAISGALFAVDRQLWERLGAPTSTTCTGRTSIGATLDSLLADVEADEFEVVVVCNGCTDDTADAARRRDGVQVEELAASSKIAALRHGETVATVFPRIYLDGDVELSTAAARQLVAALDVDEPRAAGVVGRLDTTDATVPTRWYFDFRQRLPVFAQGIIGAGVYAMNEGGRKRFDTWPDVIGDDQFVFRLFDEHERITVSGHHTRVQAPRDLATVVRRQVRVRRGNAQLTTGGGDRAPLGHHRPGSLTRCAMCAHVRPHGLAWRPGWRSTQPSAYCRDCRREGTGPERRR